MKIHGWGRYPVVQSEILLPQTENDCLHLIKEHSSLIPRGLGRSYGDSANSSTVLQSSYLDHYIHFDQDNGVLVCQSGVSIQEILKLIIPKGWFIPVTPGTSYVTIGGAIASDVHGKNHHLSGAFSEHLISFDLMLASGEIVQVTRTGTPDLFHATCGGMGLTGVVLTATIQLKAIQSSNIIQTTIKANCLEEICFQFEQNSQSTYSVAWIDCLAKGKQLGRSLLMTGEHAQDGILKLDKKKSLNVPVDVPSILLNQYTIKAFNALYYHKTFFQNQITTLAYKPYFYPLDTLSNWNRLYGKNGFIQYQFVIPKAVGVQGLKNILTTIADSGKGSFLAVLKMFGPENENYLSFPQQGYTLALDFKLSIAVIQLIERLDAMIVDMGGRVYLTKDALMSEAFFKKTYPKWEKFQEVRAKYGALGKFSSDQSKRLGLS